MSDTTDRSATAVQNLFISPNGERVNGLTATSFFRPLDETGGDFWWLKSVGKQDALFFLGDVTGHGNGAGLVTALIGGSVEMARLGMGQSLQPHMLANLVSHCLLGLVQGQFLSTGLIARFDVATRTLSMVNAGHPAPRLIRDGLVTVEKGPGHPPLGSSRSHRYDNQEIVLESGDLLFVFSDGVTEGVNPAGEQFGERRLQAVLEENATKGPVALKAALLDALAVFTENYAALDDDLTFVFLELN